ncbi:MAG: response regulator transcription factor [Acidimicrobiia bacterium]|nr:response regulator transcription factor [Acidimicrobiia bacterium]
MNETAELTLSLHTILIIEDEAPIAAAVAARLRSEGLTVEIASDGHAGVAACERLKPDLVILDLMLPGIDGLEVCRQIQSNRAVPVIILTARDSEEDLLRGLATGADDYMTKPFSTRELVARVHAMLRRVERQAEALRSGGVEALSIGTATLNAVTRRASLGQEDVHLTPTEFDLALTFASDPERVFTREELLAAVWGYDVAAGERTVDSHIRSLRSKLGADSIRTVHGVGYACHGEST